MPRSKNDCSDFWKPLQDPVILWINDFFRYGTLVSTSSECKFGALAGPPADDHEGVRMQPAGPPADDPDRVRAQPADPRTISKKSARPRMHAPDPSNMKKEGDQRGRDMIATEAKRRRKGCQELKQKKKLT